MSNAIQPFAFEDKLVRTLLDEQGEPRIVAKDVALALGYQWNGAARIAHVPEEWRRVTSVVTLRGDAQDMQILSEQGLYFFVARSDKPAALPFQRWLAGEVLPSLRRTGRYALAPDSLEDALASLSPRVRLHCLRLAVQVSLAANAPQGVEATFARFCSLVKERPTEERPEDHDLPGLLRHVLTLLLVLIGWVFFFSSSPAAAFGWIGRMFGSGNALVDATAKYYLAGCWPLLLVGAIGSFPVVSHVGTTLLRRSKAWQAFSVVLFLALLLLCIALMMNDTYSTFLYFQF